MLDHPDISPESIRALIEELAKPIDFEALESDGILRKESTWYRLFKPHELLRHVSRKISAIKEDGKGVLAQFESERPYQEMKDRLK
jgi:hypothetical protein